MGAPFLFLIVGAVSVDVVNGESKLHAFVGWLSGQKDCFDGVELCAVVGERSLVVAQDNGQRLRTFPILFIQSSMSKLFVDPSSCHLVLRGLYQ